MAENAPANGAEAARGQPYYEKLKKDIRATIANKRRLDARVAELDDQIFNYETSYLENTPFGNIIKGFDNYIKGSAGAAGATGGAGARKKNAILDSERIFSRSSYSYTAGRASSPDSQSQPSHAPTPTHESNAPTPTSTTGNKAGGSSLKRTKKGDKDDDDPDAKPPKRLKMTFKQSEKD